MNSDTYILATPKTWHNSLFDKLCNEENGKWLRVASEDELNHAISENKPRFVFFPHWSFIISSKTLAQTECVIFHMTDLPYGRGGSPLQNLIVRGKKDTMLSAIRAEKGLDTGPVYLKEKLSLEGAAKEIFRDSSLLIFKMINKIISEKIVPVPQEGNPTVFKRRTPEMSNMKELTELENIFDHIRMLDAEGYPHAFLETESFRFEFRNVEKQNKELIANVRIIQK